jgi:leader peptidase (prepilin peptidase)/N-methyltransferase
MFSTYAHDASMVPWEFWSVVGGVFGLVIASFIGVVGERVPRKETLWGRSHCVCGKQLGDTANLPVIGWLVLRGRAKCCGAKIPVRYVIGEAGLCLTWGAIAGLSSSYLLAAILMLLSALVLLALSWRKPEVD